MCGGVVYLKLATVGCPPPHFWKSGVDVAIWLEEGPGNVPDRAPVNI